MNDWESDIRAVAALDDSIRRKMYVYVKESGRAVSRDEAAHHVGISRKLAAWHLDKLVERGLLRARYGRVRSKGAGRSSKLYEPSAVSIDVSLPARRYDVIARILVAAIAEGNSIEGASRVAAETGQAIGEATRKELHLRPPGDERAMRIAAETLKPYGFEPYADDSGRVSMRNCPFHDVARQSPEVVCRLSCELIDGVVRGLGNQTIEAIVEQTPGECCVKLLPREKQTARVSRRQVGAINGSSAQ